MSDQQEIDENVYRSISGECSRCDLTVYVERSAGGGLDSGDLDLPGTCALCGDPLAWNLPTALTGFQSGVLLGRQDVLEEVGRSHRADLDDGRTVAVIDPKNTQQVEKLAHALTWAEDNTNPELEPDQSVKVRYALREYIDPRPAKPEEPQGLGAVVEDALGLLWVRCHGPRGGQPATWTSGIGNYRSYGNVDAVKVVSEGFTGQ